MNVRNRSLVAASLGAIAACSVLAALRPPATAEDAAKATASPSPGASAEATQVNLLYTINNLGYTGTCG